MKKFLICTMLVLTIAGSFSQQSNFDHSLKKQDYLQKSKKQKTTAWILLGGGAAVVAGSAILDVSSDWTKSETPYVVAICVGGASMIGSIPLFIASGRNRRKAMNATTYFEIRQNAAPTNTGTTFRSTPTLSIKVDF